MKTHQLKPDLYSLRQATEQDFAFLSELHRLTMKEYVSQIWGWDDRQQEQLLRERFAPEALQIVLSESAEVGVLQVVERDEDLYLEKIYLLPTWQNKRLGSAIIRSLQERAITLSKPLTLSVLRPNPARKLYERLGFIVTGEDSIRYWMKWAPEIRESEFRIRRAQPADARGIHDAHMQSIRELCANDYTKEQLDAWGCRPFDEAMRIKAIVEGSVFVIARADEIFGFGHLVKAQKDLEKRASIKSLYLVAEVQGRGLGHLLIEELEREAREFGATVIELNATRTALGFYKGHGYHSTGEEVSFPINGVPIPSIPMVKILSLNGESQ